MKNTVMLENGTVGTVNASTIDFQDINDFIGETMTVKINDENGNEIELTGKMVSVIE